MVKNLSDAELFAATGGLTGHKAARHGSKMGGKLARVEEADRLLAAQLAKGKGVSDAVQDATDALKAESRVARLRAAERAVRLAKEKRRRLKKAGSDPAALADAKAECRATKRALAALEAPEPAPARAKRERGSGVDAAARVKKEKKRKKEKRKKGV